MLLRSALLHWDLDSRLEALFAHRIAQQNSSSCRPHGAAFSCVALHWIEFGALNLDGESLKVCIDSELGWELYILVLED